MNQIERLHDDLTRQFPDLFMEIDAPDKSEASWFLDLRPPGDVPAVIVEWRPDRGFGIATSTPDADDYGSGPDEIYTNEKATLDRVVQLILSAARTEPPKAVRLAELRQLLGLSQEELAERAGVGQANISRIEARGDIKVSTLARLIAAMGATLSMRARFPDGTVRELEV
jgi:DNA-binding XRE family transcriptional regulator